MTSVPTITEFLEARIAEDEVLARAATPGPWLWWNLEDVDQGWADNGPNLDSTQGEWKACEYYCTWKEPDTLHRGENGKPGHEHLVTEQVIGSWGHDAHGVNIETPDATHIATHDPKRVLAECAAKRAVLESWTNLHERNLTGDPVRSGMYSALSDVVADLASVYADHPDYQQEWA